MMEMRQSSPSIVRLREIPTAFVVAAADAADAAVAAVPVTAAKLRAGGAHTRGSRLCGRRARKPLQPLQAKLQRPCAPAAALNGRVPRLAKTRAGPY